MKKKNEKQKQIEDQRELQKQLNSVLKGATSGLIISGIAGSNDDRPHQFFSKKEKKSPLPNKGVEEESKSPVKKQRPIRELEHEYFYLNPKSKQYQNEIKKFKNRSFLLPEHQDIADVKNFVPDDKTTLQLYHECKTCGTVLFGDKITQNSALVASKGRDNERFRKSIVFRCVECKRDFEENPYLRIQVGDPNYIRREKVEFEHPIELRKLLEDDLFQVDDHYRSLKQMNVSWIRQQKPSIYWSMIWYFCSVKLPYEFLIPYSEKELAEDFYKDYLILKTQLRIEEMVEQYGQDTVEEIMRKRLEKAIAKAAKKAQDGQAKNKEAETLNQAPIPIVSVPGDTKTNAILKERKNLQNEQARVEWMNRRTRQKEAAENAKKKKSRTKSL